MEHTKNNLATYSGLNRNENVNLMNNNINNNNNDSNKILFNSLFFNNFLNYRNGSGDQLTTSASQDARFDERLMESNFELSQLVDYKKRLMAMNNSVSVPAPSSNPLEFLHQYHNDMDLKSHLQLRMAASVAANRLLVDAEKVNVKTVANGSENDDKSSISQSSSNSSMESTSPTSSPLSSASSSLIRQHHHKLSQPSQHLLYQQQQQQQQQHKQLKHLQQHQLQLFPYHYNPSLFNSANEFNYLNSYLLNHQQHQQLEKHQQPAQQQQQQQKQKQEQQSNAVSSQRPGVDRSWNFAEPIGNVDLPNNATKNNNTTGLQSTNNIGPNFMRLSSEKLSIKRPKSTYPFGKCKVCNDKATGVHYGIATCEGCKGFFKRSTLRKEKYRCFFGNNCPLTPDNRNRCKACRFKKCLDVGMSIQGVKMGRIPKAEKERALMTMKRCKVDRDVNEDENYEVNDPEENDELDEEEYMNVNSNNNSTTSNQTKQNNGNDQENEKNFNYDDEECSNLSEQNNLYICGPAGDDNGMPVNQHSTESNSEEEDEREPELEPEPEPEPESEPVLDVNSAVQKQPVCDFIKSLTQFKNKANSIELSNKLLNSLNITNEKNELDNSAHNVDKSAQNEIVQHQPECNLELKLLEKSESLMSSAKDSVLYNLLDSHPMFKSCNLLTGTTHSNFHSLNRKFDENYQIIMSLLSDKVYQIIVESNERENRRYEPVMKLLRGGPLQRATDSDDNVSIVDVWDGILESIPSLVKDLISLVKELPGLNELKAKDFATIINNRLFDYYVIRYSYLYANDDCFIQLPNGIQYTRARHLKVIGPEMVNALFTFTHDLNELALTPRETALMYPYLLTVHDNAFEDPATIANLNEYYCRGLMYEFDLNKRSNQFVNKWRKLMAGLPQLNELQAKKIGSLKPIMEPPSVFSFSIHSILETPEVCYY